MDHNKTREGYIWICVKSFRNRKTGKRVCANEYGKKAFCFWVKKRSEIK